MRDSKQIIIALLIAAVVILGTVLYSQDTAIRKLQDVKSQPASLGTAQASREPTAAEIFHLRSECAALGEKILDKAIGGHVGEDPVGDPRKGPVLRRVQGGVVFEDGFGNDSKETDQFSHYDPLTNRCYIELTESYFSVQDPGKYGFKYTYTLYDGQTGEQLEFTTDANEGAPGTIHSKADIDEKMGR
jgi:hypothetical protein